MLKLVTFTRFAKRRTARRKTAKMRITKILYGEKHYIRFYPPLTLSYNETIVEEKGTFYIENPLTKTYRELGTYLQYIRKFIYSPTGIIIS